MPYKDPEAKRAYRKKYYENNIENALEYNKEWQQNNKEKVRKYSRKSKTGWDAETFEKVWNEQKGRCAVCKAEMLKLGHKSNSVSADHNHKTGQIRGLLCSICNTGLGFFERFQTECTNYLDKYVE
jgi:Recombination endonuclease VII